MSRFEERLRRLAVTAAPQLNQARLGNAMLVRFWTSAACLTRTDRP
jgi:hypothetical protein